MKSLYENTILVVDDTPENIEILVELLDGFDLKVAINGLEALETAWEDQAPDLILLDIMMPEMDGYEACRQLRADERTRDVPVIFLTAKTQKEDVYKAFEAGGQDYVTKPFDARELMERVKTQLELKAQREVLRNINQILEEKVQQRTAELEIANKELQGLDEAKNNFLMMISHELRTPLNGIVGAAYFLNDTLSENDELAEFVDMLKLSVDRLEKFSTTALLITELSTRQAISLSDIKLDESILACIAKVQAQAKNKGISLTSTESKGQFIVKGDQKLIDIALCSVLDNAIKYSPTDGNIVIGISNQTDGIVVEVSDSGNGFSETALQNLFKPFGLGEKHYDKNLGLSLKATKTIMEVLKGEILVHNLDGKGALVKLVFRGTS